jgi:hypothetical protein
MVRLFAEGKTLGEISAQLRRAKSTFIAGFVRDEWLMLCNPTHSTFTPRGVDK